MQNENAPFLEVASLSKRFGGVQAVLDYELSLAPGEIVGLIGPNGAGKTTVFNLLSGVLAPTSGSIRAGGREIAGRGPEAGSAAGIGRTFQNIRLFPALSVLDNVRAACHRRLGRGLWPTLFRLPGARASEAAILARAREMLEIMNLSAAAEQPAGSLPYGDQRRLEIARALAAGPTLLLLDEPAAGLNPGETEGLRQAIRALRDRFGLTVLLVEHDMGLVMRLCERVQVLVHGRLLTEGPPAAVQADQRVVAAYLGSGGADA